MKKRWLAALMLGVAVIAVVAFASTAGGSSSKSGGTFRIGTSSGIDSLNPYVAFNQDAYATFQYIYPILVQYDKTNLKFDKTSLQAKAGKVSIAMKNPAPIAHDVSIEGKGVDQKGKIVKSGGTSTVTADLKPGTYTFYCSVDAHRQAGMQGTLTVK